MLNSVSEGIIYIKHRAAIAGYVTDAITGKGISGATVEVVGKNLRTLTREDGFFYFVDIEKETYTLNIFVPEESRSRYGGSVNNPIKSVTVKVDDEPGGKPKFDQNANVKLSPSSLHSMT